MKVIKKFRDGTALVQRAGKNPEIINAAELDSIGSVGILEISSITSEGFVIDKTKLSISPDTKFVLEMQRDGEYASNVIKGKDLINLFETLINNINAR